MYYVLNRLVYILLVLLVAVSCSKVNRTQKKLNGEWDIIGYKITKPSGLTYHYDPSGKANFGSCTGSLCEYSIDMDYQDQGVTIDFSNNGNYEFVKEDGEYFDIYRDNGGNFDTIKDARIIMITRDDLLLEFGDLSGRHIFTMAKP